MNRLKNLSCLILALAISLTLAAGCTAKSGETAGTGSDTSSAESAASDIPAGVGEDYAAFSYSEGIDENGFFEGVTALDYIEGFNYLGLPIPANIHQISQDSVEAEVNRILADYSSTEQITDRAVADGDTVNIDYVGSVDGVEFDGGSTGGAGTDVTIGVTSYIDDFLEQLIGHTPGETVNVEVTFPEVYHEESLQNKDALFVTTINYITQTKEPELTDAFVKENLFEAHGWETVAAMKEGVAEQLQKEAVQNYVFEYLRNSVAVSSIPDVVLEYQEKSMLRYYFEGAEYYDMDFDEFLSSYVGVGSADELVESNRESNLQSATYALVSQAVAEDASITVNEDDMVKYLEGYSDYVEQYGLPYLKQVVLLQKITDYIADNSVFE